MNISNRRKVGGNYFRLYKDNNVGTSLDTYLSIFNFNDYYCFKTSGHQKSITREEFLDFKYSGYTFFTKDLYDKNNIITWIDWMVQLGGIQYLVKPTPPFHPDKIIIRK